MSIRSIAIISSLTLPLALIAAHQDASGDRHLAEKIQKAVAKDDSHSLSSSAHGVKVIVEDGVITLRGTVQSDEERQAIQGEAESFAIQARNKAFADAAEIHNELTVAPSD